MAIDAATVAKLEELTTAIGRYGDPRRASEEWKLVFRMLQKIGLPVAQINGVVGMRDLGRLSALVQQMQQTQAAPPPGEVPAEDVCRKALAAFRKRLALTVLDEESKLGRGPLSKGAGSGKSAIIPPEEWPDAVWQELARQGKLRYIGHGFYELGKL